MKKLSILFSAVILGAVFAAGTRAAEKSDKVVGPPDVAWKDMTAKQRGKFMKDVVVPKMKPTFQEFDAKAFKEFNCATCHGKDPKAVKFKMPTPDIHPLPGTEAKFMAALKTEPTWPKWTEFMSKKVEPQMAALLGLPMFDPKKPSPDAFGCNRCHTIEKE